ncbi:restriction endonuclease subunit S [Candidatus Pacearchaeota archaeon]|nr:restriction endonuclease subunit S [Candidatus Pacearchaeota archaeon]
MQKQKNKPIWKEVQLGEIFDFKKKSGRKAGEGLKKGKYFFFTSSENQTKFLNECDYSEESLIFSTGGKAGVHYCDDKFSASNDCFVVNIKGNILPKYIYYYLRSRMYLLEQGFKGAGLKHLSKNYLKSIKIPLPYTPEGKPDLATQKQIVAVLEKAEKLKQKQKRQLELYDEYLKSVFWEMFLKEKGRWEEKSLSEVCELKSGGTPSRLNKEFFNGKIPWITTISLGKKYINENDAVEFITKEAVEKSTTKIIPKNSIIFGTRVGVGKTSINLCDICTNQDIVSLTNIDKSLINEFLIFFLDNLSSYFIDQKRGATIQGITSSVLKSLKIPLPPLELQQKFASIVEKVEKLKEKQKKSLADAEELFNALMQRAFQGELG